MRVDVRGTPRPTRDDWLLSVALETARRSTCVRRHYGAVVATPAGEIISTGYNGAPRGYSDEPYPGRRPAVGCSDRRIVTCTQCGRDIAEYEAGVEK